MIIRVRNNIGDYDVTNSDNWPDSRISQYLHEASIHVQSIVEQMDSHYFEEELDQAMGASDTEISLPTGFKSLIDIRRLDTNKRFKIIDRHQLAEVADTNQPKYVVYFTKDKIRYARALDEAHTCRVTYIKELQTITTGSSWNIPRVMESAIILKSTLEILASEGVKHSKFDEEYRKSRESLLTLEDRQKSEPRYVNYVQK